MPCIFQCSALERDTSRYTGHFRTSPGPIGFSPPPAARGTRFPSGVEGKDKGRSRVRRFGPQITRLSHNLQAYSPRQGRGKRKARKAEETTGVAQLPKKCLSKSSNRHLCGNLQRNTPKEIIFDPYFTTHIKGSAVLGANPDLQTIATIWRYGASKAPAAVAVKNVWNNHSFLSVLSMVGPSNYIESQRRSRTDRSFDRKVVLVSGMKRNRENAYNIRLHLHKLSLHTFH